MGGAATLDLVDPTSALVAQHGSTGDLIESLRDDCGFVIQGIDWVARKINSSWDLIALIFEPIAGDFGGVQALGGNWVAVGTALSALGDNYDEMAAAIPAVWEGRAADKAQAKLSKFAEAFHTQGEAGSLMAEATEAMLTATQATCEAVATALSMVDDLVIALLGSALGVAKEILTGGAKVRKIISLIDKVLGLIKMLDSLVPKLISAIGKLRNLFIGMNVVFALAAAGTNAHTGKKVDDPAGAAF